ncbi:MAG: universal stress protein [Deltaproteobacteria bacterium]|nr:universal stress protein [Deltaproteobacteria bacterium]
MTSIVKLLCATNEAEVSRKAELFAARAAKLLGAELTYLYVTPVDPEQLEAPGHLDVTILDELATREHDVLQHAGEVARHQGVENARCVVVHSRHTAAAVVEYAEKHGMDHIVTGSSGRVGIPRFILGSVAGEIIHKAHCPVTVVR